MNQSRRDLSSLLMVLISLLITQAAFPQQYVKRLNSPFKSDPPGTYIETRPDGARNYYRGGIKHQIEDRRGRITAVAPPTHFEVRSNGELVRVTYNGFNSTGNKIWSREKVADMLPSEYIVHGRNGEIIKYDVDAYLKASRIRPPQHAGSSDRQLVVVSPLARDPGLVYFPPPSDPTASTGYVVFHLNNWPEYRENPFQCDPFLDITIRTEDGSSYTIKQVDEETASKTFYALHVPSGSQQFRISITLNALSFSNLDAEKSGLKELKRDDSTTRFRYNRVVGYDSDTHSYYFAHNTWQSIRVYTFVTGSRSIETEMRIYGPRGAVKIVQIDLSGLLKLEREITAGMNRGRTPKALQQLVKDPDFNDLDMFTMNGQSIFDVARRKNWKRPPQLRWHLSRYSWGTPKWEIDPVVRPTDIARFDEWLCDNKLQLITLGEIAAPGGGT